MRQRSCLVVSSLLLISVSGGGVRAQTIQFTVKEVALKSGESVELGDVFYISTSCKSVLKATPEVEILDGPPGVTAVINPAKVVPRGPAAHPQVMSALPPKADMCSATRDVCFGPKATSPQGRPFPQTVEAIVFGSLRFRSAIRR
jgi:hypothetical protein